MIEFQVTFRWAWKCPKQLLLNKYFIVWFLGFQDFDLLKFLKDLTWDLKSKLKLDLQLKPLFSSRILDRPSLQRPMGFHSRSELQISEYAFVFDKQNMKTEETFAPLWLSEVRKVSSVLETQQSTSHWQGLQVEHCGKRQRNKTCSARQRFF